MKDRGYMVSAKTVKKHWFRENDIEIEITDGQHTIRLDNHDFFVLDTDKPLSEQLIWKGSRL